MGFEDESWWSRLAIPNLHSWAEAGKPLCLTLQSVAKDDTEPKALACYGMLVRWVGSGGFMLERPWLRFVDGRPVSRLTTAFLEWSCDKLNEVGRKALLLIWAER